MECRYVCVTGTGMKSDSTNFCFYQENPGMHSIFYKATNERKKKECCYHHIEVKVFYGKVVGNISLFQLLSKENNNNYC